MRFVHLTLPSGIVRDLGPCTLQPDDLTVLREAVLPKLRRGSLILPAQPRYRLSGSMAATGGWMFVLRARHGIGAVVARIGIGWRDHGASLVWQECVGDRNEEPSRPWVVDALDPTEFFSLNRHEVSRLVRWVPVLACDLAWAVVPPGTPGDRIAPTDKTFSCRRAALDHSAMTPRPARRSRRARASTSRIKCACSVAAVAFKQLAQGIAIGDLGRPAIDSVSQKTLVSG